jgi:hypothetical protein
MVTTDSSSRPAVWEAAIWRFTPFFKALPNAPYEEVYQAFFGMAPNEPELTQEMPPEAVGYLASVRDGAVYGAVFFEGKIDFIATPLLALPKKKSEGPIPTFESECTQVKWFIDRAENWLPTAEGVNRVGIGARFISKQESKEDCYKTLADKLPAVQIDPKGSSDFFYRINRSRELDFDGKRFKVNRLCSWSAGFFKFEFESSEGHEHKVVNFAALADPDVNTTPAFNLGQLDATEKLSLTKVLFEIVLQLGEKGDVQ